MSPIYSHSCSSGVVSTHTHGLGDGSMTCRLWGNHRPPGHWMTWAQFLPFLYSLKEIDIIIGYKPFFKYSRFLLKVCVSSCQDTDTHKHTPPVCKYRSMLTHTHKTVICSSSPQYIRHCNRPHDIRSNECIHQCVQCDGTCVFLSPGPQQPRKPHVHLCGFEQPPEPHRNHPALQQKGKTFSLSLTLPFLTSIVCGFLSS